MSFRYCLALLPLFVVACAADAEDGIVGDDPELRTSGIKSIEIGRSTGFVPPPPPGFCRESGRYTIDFDAKQITGDGCIDGRKVEVDRRISDDELAKVKGAVSRVRTAPRPAACPTDIGATSLTVKRATSEAHFVDQRSACGGARPAVSSTLAALLDVAEELAVAGAAKVAGFDFSGFKVAELGGAEICPEIVDAVAMACNAADGKAMPAKGCKTLCSVPVAPRGKVAGFDFGGFKVADQSGDELCPEIVDAVAGACFDAGGKASPAKSCKTLCSVPVAPRGKVAGYDFDGPKIMNAAPENMACIELVRPEEEACREVNGRIIQADDCHSLCSKPILPR
jgi:hypothetical protein